jgi:hypothetical protein
MSCESSSKESAMLRCFGSDKLLGTIATPMRRMVMNFSELTGQKVLVHINISQLEQYIQGGSTAIVKVTAVESRGIWVQHEGLHRDLGKLSGAAGNHASQERC